MKISYEINGEVFTTKKSVEERVKCILYSYAGGQELSQDDFDFISDLLTLHDGYEQKRGCGIESIFIRSNPVYRIPGFWIRRIDGTETDFSYLKCLRPSSKRREFEQALRAAVAPDIQQFRIDFFSRGPSRCPFTGESLTFANAHVDHAAPYTFKSLVDSFIDTYVYDFDRVEILGKGVDGVIQRTLADDGLMDSWIAYHRQWAKLRVVSRTANLSLLKRGE